MDQEEQKKYELVLIETALLVFRGYQDPKDLLITLDSGRDGQYPKVYFSETLLNLDNIILSAVSYVCGIRKPDRNPQFVQALIEVGESFRLSVCNSKDELLKAAESRDDGLSCLYEDGEWNLNYGHQN